MYLKKLKIVCDIDMTVTNIILIYRASIKIGK